MCLIAIAGKDKDKYSKEFINGLITASITNSDGIGFAYKKDKTKEVYISKGYKTINKALAAMRKKKIGKKDELIVHLRIGNRGEVNTDMCHPFVIANNATDILQNKTIVNQPVMAHNGTFYNYGLNSKYSDTFHFILEFLSKSKIMDILEDNLEFFKDIFSIKLSTNRLVFLFPNSETNFIKIGDWVSENGYFYSNKSFEDRSIRNVGGYETNNLGCLRGSNYRGSEEWREDLEDWNFSLSENARRIKREKKEAEDREEKRIRDVINSGNSLNSLSEIDDSYEDEDDDNNDIQRPTLLFMNDTIIFEVPKIDITPLNSRIKPKIITVFPSLRKEETNCSNFKTKPKLRLANSNEISVDKETFDLVFKNSDDIGYYEYMNLYIPELVSSGNQFNELQYKPTKYNYCDLLLKCIESDTEYGLEKGNSYLIVDQPEENHVVLVKMLLSTNKKTSFIYLPEIYINSLFIVTILPSKTQKYYDYYRLVKGITPDKFLLTRLKLFMHKNEKYINNENNINFNNTVNVSREALDLLKCHLVEIVYPNNSNRILDKMYVS